MYKLMLAVLLVFCSEVAKADWEANFTAVSSKGEFPKVVGKFFSKRDRFRIDTNYPFDMSVFAKSNSNKVSAAVHSFKIHLSSSPERFSGQLPACLSQDFSRCVRELKLKKVGSEKCGARRCDIFEGLPKVQGMKKVKLWHWAGEVEPIFSRTVLTKTNGTEIRTDFTDIEKKVRSDSFFSIPAGYKDAGSLEKFFNDSQGDSN